MKRRMTRSDKRRTQREAPRAQRLTTSRHAHPVYPASLTVIERYPIPLIGQLIRSLIKIFITDTSLLLFLFFPLQSAQTSLIQIQTRSYDFLPPVQIPQALAAFSFSVSSGTAVNKSATRPWSAIWKIGASGSCRRQNEVGGGKKRNPRR
jgi:hypothetical protein